MKPRRIAFHYTLKDTLGTTLESSHGEEPLSYVEGMSQIIPGLETGLHGVKTGDKRVVNVKADQAYGKRDDRLIVTVELTDFPDAKTVKIGQTYGIEVSDNVTHQFRVTELSKTHATLDGNHPLAGQDLSFSVEVQEAREATEAEVEAAADEMEHECCDGDHSHSGHSH